MSKVGRRQSGAAEAGNGKVEDAAASAGTDRPEEAVTPDDGVKTELFGLNEEPAGEAPAERWPTGAELTEAGRDIAGSLAGAGDWVLQLDGTDIEFADIERPAEGGKGARIQMWDGSELIFEEAPDDVAPASGGKSGKRPRRG
ncbi:MAG: hypothetical protein RJQ21_14485 [Rhodospirillales bacterium]